MPRPDVGMEVQVEGLQLLVEAFQILREGGRVVPGAPVGPVSEKPWGVALGMRIQAPGSAPSYRLAILRLRASVYACSQGRAWG